MSAPLEIFCCYAREDQEMLEYLKKHLMPLQRSGQITVWSDTNLNAGVEWEKELHQHLESANIILESVRLPSRRNARPFTEEF